MTKDLPEQVEAIVIFCRQHNEIGNVGWNKEIDKLLDLIAQQTKLAYEEGKKAAQNENL